MERRLAAILAADVVGYSRLMSDDEKATLAALKLYRGKALEPAISRHPGRVVKLMGDGVLAESPSVVAAGQCAIGMQKTEAAAPGPIRWHIGVDLGDLIIDGDDIYNMVGDPAHQYLADRLCEDLTTALSKIDTLGLVSRTAAFVEKNRQVSAVEAARALDAGYATEGSVRTAESRGPINAQLIDRDTGSQFGPRSSMAASTTFSNSRTWSPSWSSPRWRCIRRMGRR